MASPSHPLHRIDGPEGLPPYYDERAAVYNALVEKWNAEHRAADSYAFVSMDGNGSDPTYFDAHRALSLDTRHIIEE